MKYPYYFVFDIESVGLHGEAFSYGYCVVTPSGQEVAHGYCNKHPRDCQGTQDDHDWVQQNVPVDLPFCASGIEMRKAFWDSWGYWRAQGAVMAAEVPWPVESNFLEDCIKDDPKRSYTAPYPLIDIASVRFAKGLDPLATCDRLEEEMPPHNPLADARQSARLLTEALQDVLP